MSFKDKITGLVETKLVPFFKNTTTKRVGIAVSTFVLVTVILSLNFLPNQLKLKPGDVAPKTIKAPRSIEFEDKLKTSEAKRQAARSVGKVHDEDPGAFRAFTDDVDSFFTVVKGVQEQPAVDDKTKTIRLKEQLPIDLPDEELYTSLVTASPEVLRTISDTAKEMVKEAMDAGITEDNLDITKKRLLDEKVAVTKFAPEYKTILGLLLKNYLRPNFIFNEEATNKKIEAAVDAVSPVRVSVKQGEKIVGEGEIITQDQVFTLEALGILKDISLPPR